MIHIPGHIEYMHIFVIIGEKITASKNLQFGGCFAMPVLYLVVSWYVVPGINSSMYHTPEYVIRV